MFRRYWWLILVFIPVGMVCGLLVAAVVTYLMPKKYDSFCVVEPPLPRAGGHFWKATEIEKVTSRRCLERAVDRLMLTERWGMDKETSLAALRHTLAVSGVTSSDLIRIRARHRNPGDARDIAYAVTRSYLALSDQERAKDGLPAGEGRVLDEPVEPRMPASPLVAFNLAIGSVAGALLSLPAALALMALLPKRPVPAPSSGHPPA